MGMNGQQSGKAAPEWGEGFANHASDFRITVQSAQKTKIQQQTASSKHGLRTGAGIAPQRTRDWPTTRCAPALTTRETQTSPSEATSPVGAAAVHTPENTHCPRGRGDAGTLRTATGMDNGAAAAETRTGVLKN